VHNSAIIVNSKSSIAIAEAVEKILDDKESLNQIDLEYLSRNYSLDLMAKRYVALILKLLLA
jgi:glycosyltransferase involved in cell wall biosynthesis